MSYHLIADYVTAQRILEEFISNQKVFVSVCARARRRLQPDGFDTEHSELLLYTNMVMREAGLLNEAVAHLEENAALIYDKQAYLETKGR
jgi:peptide alpha-N-acetyltransferase